LLSHDARIYELQVLLILLVYVNSLHLVRFICGITKPFFRNDIMLQNDKRRYCMCIVYCGTCDTIRITARYVSGTLFI